jgi:hypothetical protein
VIDEVKGNLFGRGRDVPTVYQEVLQVALVCSPSTRCCRGLQEFENFGIAAAQDRKWSAIICTPRSDVIGRDK